jgi:hypothetical protein
LGVSALYDIRAQNWIESATSYRYSWARWFNSWTPTALQERTSFPINTANDGTNDAINFNGARVQIDSNIYVMTRDTWRIEGGVYRNTTAPVNLAATASSAAVTYGGVTWVNTETGRNNYYNQSGTIDRFADSKAGIVRQEENIFEVGATGAAQIRTKTGDVMIRHDGSSVTLYNGSNQRSIFLDILTNTFANTQAYRFKTTSPTNSGIGYEIYRVDSAGLKIYTTGSGNTTVPARERFDVDGNIAFKGALKPENLSGTPTAGAKGQILKTNGDNAAPSWTDSLPNEFITHDQLGTYSFSAGKEIKTCGFSVCGDSGQAVYQVYLQAALTGSGNNYSNDGYGVVQLANGNWALMQAESGLYNARAFGVKADGSNQDVSMQRAIDWVANVAKSGKVVLPRVPNPNTDFYVFDKTYITEGAKLIGEGKPIKRTSGSVTEQYGTKVKITGLGFVVGAKTHSDLNTAYNTELAYMYIQGTNTAISGLRLGSDVSFKGHAKGYWHDLQIKGFTSSTAIQPIYDKSTVALGSADTDYPNTFPITGAAGVFISNVIAATMENCDIDDNYYNLAESSGGKSTTFTSRNNYYKGALNRGIWLTTLKASNFQHDIIEGNFKEGIALDIPVTATAGMRNLIAGIRFENIHMEVNGFERSTNPSLSKVYGILIKNQNVGSQIFDVKVSGSYSSPYCHGVRVERGRNIDIWESAGVAANDTALLATNSEQYTNIYRGEKVSNAFIETDNWFWEKDPSNLRLSITATIPAATTIAPGATYSQAVTLTGIASGQNVGSSINLTAAELVDVSWVQGATSANTITVVIRNNGSSIIDLSGKTITVTN